MSRITEPRVSDNHFDMLIYGLLTSGTQTGDGRTDDTAAIQRAITEGNRCTPGYCESSTNTPALVYFPGGTYVISSSIIDYYYTQVRHITPLKSPIILADFTRLLAILTACPPYKPPPTSALLADMDSSMAHRTKLQALVLEERVMDLPIRSSGRSETWSLT